MNSDMWLYFMCLLIVVVTSAAQIMKKLTKMDAKLDDLKHELEEMKRKE